MRILASVLIVACTTFFTPFQPAEALGTFSAPEYIAGADATGLANSGNGNNAFGVFTTSRAIYVVGNYAYVAMSASSTACSATADAAGNGCEFKIFNITSKANPVYMGGGDISGSTNSGTGSKNARAVVVSGNYAYLVGDGNATACSATPGSAIGCELQVWDISNPANPTYVAGGDAGGDTNADTDNASFVGLAIDGNNLAIASNGSATTCSNTDGSGIGCEYQFWDITTPTAPEYLAGRDITAAAAGSGTGNVSAAGVTFINSTTVAFVSLNSGTTCSSTAGSGIGCELKIWDVSTFSNPSYSEGLDVTGSTNTGTGNISMTSVTTISSSYIATSQNGNATACSATPGSAIGCEIKVWDVSTPTASVYVGGGDVTGGTNTGSISGNLPAVFHYKNHLIAARAANTTNCNGATDFRGCELQIWDVSTPSAPDYVGGGDTTGTTNSGTGGGTTESQKDTVFAADGYAYVGSLGNGTATCGAGSGNADGCEMAIWQIESDAVSSGTPNWFQKGWVYLKGKIFKK